MIAESASQLLSATAMLPSLRTLRTIGRELKAVTNVALAMPLRPLLREKPHDPAAPHPVPVMLVHGLLGDPTNFLALRGALAPAGIRNFAAFAYRPQLAYQCLVARLGEAIETTCERTGAQQVDVVAHSLGGLVGRGAAHAAAGARIRRLVTLGAPYLSADLAVQELAIFGAADPLIPLPDADGPRARVVIVPECGHVGLLYDSRVASTVASYLRAPATPWRPAVSDISRCVRRPGAVADSPAPAA